MIPEVSAGIPNIDKRRESKNCFGGVGHYWIIETPHGRTSLGTCRKCNTTKYFFNAIEDILDQQVIKDPFPFPDGRKATFRKRNKLVYTSTRATPDLLLI